MTRKYSLALVLVVLVLSAQQALAGTVVFKRAFVEKYKNRATIDINFLVDHAKKSPNTIKNDGRDGDLHVAGRSPSDVGLPMVAEIMNAAMESNAVKLLQGEAGSKNPVNIVGAWRVWFEHPSKKKMTQGRNWPVSSSTNPDHVFEIHPITGVEDLDISDSLVPIPGFEAYPAEKAFPYYEKRVMTVKANKSSIQVTTTKAKYNYAEFDIELTSKPKTSPSKDGVFALAWVIDAEGYVVVDQPRRMVFVAGTEPAKDVSDLEIGDQLHVLGIPRVNLERLSAAVRKKGTKQFKANLPYEMIIVGVFED
jgi:hypothetical protein